MARADRIRHALIASVNERGHEINSGFHPYSSERDFTDIAAAADFHGIIGFVYRRLRNTPEIEPRLLASLQTRYYRGLRIHLQALADLPHLTEVLLDARIPALVIGGPADVETLYPTADLRNYREIQIVIGSSDELALVAALREASCRQIDSALSAQRKPLRWVLRYGSVATFARGLGTMPGCADLTADELFTRSDRVSLNATSVAVPNSTNRMLLMALASARGGGRLGPLKDLERMITLQPPDWRALVERAATWNVAEVLRRELRRARQLVAASVPEEVTRSRIWIAFGEPRMLPISAPSQPPAALDESAPVPPRTLPRHDPAESGLLDLLHLSPRTPPSLEDRQWQQLVTLARRELVAPLVLASLQKLRSVSVPEEPASRLALLRSEAEKQVADGRGQLVELLRTLGGRGIHPLVLKGAVAAQTVYPEPPLRPFGDIDLMVQMNEVASAHAVLIEMGYRLTGGAPTAADLASRHARGYFDPHHERLSVDLHWRYMGYPHLLPLDYKSVFARATRGALAGEPMLVPSPEDMILMSGLYFVREIWYRTPRLRYLRDIAEIGSRLPVDWDQFLRIASMPRLLRSPLFLALSLSHELLGASVPERVLRSLHPHAPVTTLLARVRLNVLRRESPRAALFQLAWLRWLDEPSLFGMAAWLKTLIVVPPPLASSQRRWMRGLWRV